MAKLFTRAEFRDRLRRKAGLIPPIDVPGLFGQPGQQPTNAPRPTNNQLNDGFADAIADINRACGFHISEISIPVTAGLSTAYGPFTISLGDGAPSTGSTNAVSPTGRINNVQRVLWVSDTDSVPRLLTPVIRDNLDRNWNSDYYAELPSTPENWYIQGDFLKIIPAQSETGTYVLTCGTGVTGLLTDTDVLDQVPIDWQGMFEDRAMYRVAITMTGDVEWQERAQSFGALSERGMMEFKARRQGDAASQPIVNFRSYRTTYGTRRLVR